MHGTRWRAHPDARASCLGARERVRYVGEEIVEVISDTNRHAMDATEQIYVEYEDLPPVIRIDAALAEGAQQLHENIPGNVCFDFDYGDEEGHRRGQLTPRRSSFD